MLKFKKIELLTKIDREPVPPHVQVTRFESVGDSVGKITRQNLHVSYPPFFH